MIVIDQMTFLTTRSAARILIMNLRHRQALLFTRPAVLLGEGRPDTRQRRKSSLYVAGAKVKPQDTGRQVKLHRCILHITY